MPGSSPFCPSTAELHVEHLAVVDGLITITVVGRRAEVPCPACGTLAGRIHSRYPRTLADLPWQGTRVRLAVTVRRIFCDATECERRIFAERLPETAARYARRTCRAAALLELVGFALGGRAGARLAASLGLATAPGTVLAQVHGAATPEVPTPRVLGVDDFAFRRGRRYGTVLVDLERRRVIDLLPDREATTLAAWLQAHPGVAIISRDRGGAYADGARQGAPAAIQIADRFHLVHNLVEALETACGRHHAALRTAAAESAATGAATGPADAPTGETASPESERAPAPDAPEVAVPSGASRLATEEREQQDRRARRLAQYAEVVALRQAGRSKQAISRTLGLARSTVAHWLAAGQFPERARPTRRRPGLLDAYAAEIAAYGATGGTSAMALRARLASLGFRGSHVTVWRALHAWRVAHGAAADGAPALHAHTAVRVPSPRQSAWLLRTPADALTPEQHAYVTALTTACPALADAQALGDRFVRLLHERDVAGFDAWREVAETSELRGFARGLRRDEAAVRQAMTSSWSNGQVEGQVHRIKLVKRSMFGRASFPLLRARMLHAA